MFKVKNKNTIATSMTSFWCFIVNFEYISHLSLVSIVDFELVNVNWEVNKGKTNLDDLNPGCYRSWVYLYSTKPTLKVLSELNEYI